MRAKKLVAVATSAVLIASATPCAALAAEANVTGGSVVATQAVTVADIKVRDATIKASALKTNLMQMKSQLKDLMLVSPTEGVVYENIEAQLPSNVSALQRRQPGTYAINFIYAPDVTVSATLTLTDDDAPAATPTFSAADAAAIAGGASVTVYGGGQTNEAHNLVASSLSVSNVTAANGTYTATATINGALVESDYASVLAPVNQGKFVYDASRSNLTATFVYDAAAKAWKVSQPAKIAFAQAPAPKGEFAFKSALTVEPGTVKGMTTAQFISYLKEQLVETAQVDGTDVTGSSDFSVALGTQLSDILAGKPGSYRIEFMYNGTGYNNEVVGSSTLTIAEKNNEPEVKPGAGTDAKDDDQDKGGQPADEKGTDNDADKLADKSVDAAKKAKPAAAKKALPQTGDVVAALPGVAGIAGAIIADIGSKLRRRH